MEERDTISLEENSFFLDLTLLYFHWLPEKTAFVTICNVIPKRLLDDPSVDGTNVLEYYWRKQSFGHFDIIKLDVPNPSQLICFIVFWLISILVSKLMIVRKRNFGSPRREAGLVQFPLLPVANDDRTFENKVKRKMQKCCSVLS